MSYVSAGITLSALQKINITIAAQCKTPISIKLDAAAVAPAPNGPHKFMLATRQVAALTKHTAAKKGLTLKLFAGQLSKQEGFIGTLLADITRSLLPGLLGNVLCGRGLQLPGTVRGCGNGVSGKHLRQEKEGD